MPRSVRTVVVGGQHLRVAVRPGDGARTPLVLANGIGASLELLQPFVDALDPSIEVLRFDVPGVGGSPLPRTPYRLPGLARLVAGLLDQLGYRRVDLLGISWGGGLAQQFALCHGDRCRRLVLAATGTGALMVPGRPQVLAGAACRSCPGSGSRRCSWPATTTRSSHSSTPASCGSCCPTPSCTSTTAGTSACSPKRPTSRPSWTGSCAEAPAPPTSRPDRAAEEVPMTPHADFYALELLLDDEDQALLLRVRTFMEKEVQPIINRYWTRAKFPHEILPGLAELGIAGLPYAGYGCPGKSPLLDGMVAMELARTDASIATFNGVHSGLAMGSIYLCGSDEQKRRWLPAMARLEKIGAFGLTEPDVGSGASRGLATTARRVGDAWVLDGTKKWIGNASFADLTVIWAKDVDD